MAEKKLELTHEEQLANAERAIDMAFATGKADRAAITQAAQLEAAEAVAMAGIAMESDEAADEAMRIADIAAKSGNREQAKEARKRERAARKKANADHRAATKSAKYAYDAIKFSAPNKMGFMRVVQVLFGLHILGVVLFLLLTSRDTMVYTVSTVMDWIMVILESVAFWMFVNRYKAARPFVIGMSAVGIILPPIVGVLMGQYNPFAIGINEAFYIFLILYFIFSRRVKATLVNDIVKDKGDYEKDDFKINRKGWPYWRNLIIYFIIFSNLGHWMEMAMCQLIILGVVQGEYDPSNTMLWRDWLFPFAMEGIAVVFIALVLYPFLEWLKKKISNRILPYVISFCANALFCTVVEFIGGMMFNAEHQCWDYSDMPFNFMGQVCLQNALAFGVAASLIAWFVYPALERLIARVSRDVMNIVFIVVLAFGVIVWSLYIIPGFGGVGSGETSQTDAQKQEMVDRTIVGLTAAGEIEQLGKWQELIDSSPGLTDEERAEIKKHIASVKEEYAAIEKLMDEPRSNSSQSASTQEVSAAASGESASVSSASSSS